MKLKSLLFGSAAVIAAGTGAQAADLPIVEPVEYVRICDAFGAGFYYIPGTDTCLKVGGRVRVESHYVFDTDDNDFSDADTEDFNNWTSRARGNIRMDARTQTDFGLVRAFIDFELTVGPDNFSEDFNANYDGTNTSLAAAFISISNDWGTYTAGHTGSFFDFFGSHTYGTRINIDDPTTEQTLFGWTFAGGNGFSFTIAAEDPASSGRRLNGEDDDYEGQEFPDGVANIRVDQGWGSAAIMGVVHNVHDQDQDDEIGWAAGAGLTIGIPGGWEASVTGGYSEGALGYLTTDPGGIGDINDDGDLNEAWTVRGGITGGIFTNVTVWLDGSYTHVEEADGEDEYDFWAVALGGYYSPVPGLIMGPEVAYNNIDYDGFQADIGVNDPQEDIFGVMWRVQREF
jgi:hypothetical protein